jgi:hypothetical protein
MTLENKDYYKCPNCGQIVSIDKLDINCSSNIVRFSDDRIVGDDAKGLFFLTHCNGCGGVFEMNKNNDANNIELKSDEIIFNAEYPTLRNCLNGLEKLKKVDKNKMSNIEFSIRKHIVWLYNDKVREGKDAFKDKEDFDIWFKNALSILKNNDDTSEGKILLKIEICRYLGEFDEAERLLSLLDDSDPYLKLDIDEISENIKNKNREIFISEYKF